MLLVGIRAGQGGGSVLGAVVSNRLIALQVEIHRSDLCVPESAHDLYLFRLIPGYTTGITMP